MSELLKAAIAGLNIDVPIYRTEEQDGVLILYLYGGRVERWPPSTQLEELPATAGIQEAPDLATTLPTMAPAGDGPDPDPVTIDDLTQIPGVGQATAQALNHAGFFNFQDLRNATDPTLLALPNINTYTTTKLRAYLRTL